MYDSGKSDRMTNLFLRFGKITSLCIASLCLILFVIGLFMYLGAAPDRLQEPEFDEFLPYLDVSNQSKKELDFSMIDTKRAVTNKYDSHIKNIIKDYNLDTGTYETIVEWLASTPINRRTRFVDGLYDFLGGYQDWLEQQKDLNLEGTDKKALFMTMANKYNRIFIQLVRQEKGRWDASYKERTYILMLLCFSLIFLVLFLMIPILIKIEENTRFFR